MYLENIAKVAYNQFLWNKLSGMNILITGATGLIGSALVDLILSFKILKCNVYALGRNSKRASKIFQKHQNNNNFHFLKHDIAYPLECEIQFDFIVHAASNGDPYSFKNDPVGTMKGNIMGTDLLWQYGLTHGLKRFLYVSSGEVYGQGEGNFTESDSGYVNPLEYRSCYPVAKRASETLCISYAHQFQKDTVIARPCHIYGAGFTESDSRAFAQFFRKAIKNEDIVMNSLGNKFRSWIYVEDCAKALLYILLKGENCCAYNIADEKSNVTIKDFAELIASESGVKIIFDIDEVESKKGTPIKTATFNTNALKSLGWKCDYNIESGIKRTIEILREELKK